MNINPYASYRSHLMNFSPELIIQGVCLFCISDCYSLVVSWLITGNQLYTMVSLDLENQKTNPLLSIHLTDIQSLTYRVIQSVKFQAKTLLILFSQK